MTTPTTALQVIRTWAAQGALVPEHVVELCDKALAAAQPQATLTALREPGVKPAVWCEKPQP